MSNTSCYILKYDHNSFLVSVAANTPQDDEGVPSTFELDTEVKLLFNLDYRTYCEWSMGL